MHVNNLGQFLFKNEEEQLRSTIANLRQSILTLNHEISSLKQSNLELRSHIENLKQFYEEKIKETKENILKIIDCKVSQANKD